MASLEQVFGKVKDCVVKYLTYLGRRQSLVILAMLFDAVTPNGKLGDHTKNVCEVLQEQAEDISIHRCVYPGDSLLLVSHKKAGKPS